MKENPLDPDSPIWTAEDFARARPATEVLPPDLARLLVRPASQSPFASALTGQHDLARGLRLAA